MSGTQTCSRCGADLRTVAPEGLCAKCMLEGALAASGREEIAEEGDGVRSGGVDHEEPSAVSGAESGRRFGDYELLEELGRGGMAVVFRARQVSLNRMVALKMIQARRLASPALVQRFRVEAETVASLKHPHIVAIHEIAEHAGQHFFSMDLIEGRSLAEIIAATARGAVDFRRAAGWVQKVAQAIHHAHQQGILHRDLKPSNILVDEHDQPRVSDFGLARRLENEATLTLTGEILGSPAYMAPEQTSGARRVTVAADIYSLGGILYELLVGRPPFSGATPAETMHQVLYTDPPRPRALNPAVPPDLETICLKCLEKEPDRRYESAQDMADELGRFLRDEPIQARPSSPVERLWRWARRNPVVAGLAGAALVLLLTIAIGSSIAAARLQRSGQLATRRLYKSLVAQAEASRWSGRPGRRFDALDALREAARLAPQVGLDEAERTRLRSELIACVSQSDVRVLRQWPGRGHPNDYVAWDGDLKLYLRETQEGWFSLRRVSDDEELSAFEINHGRLPVLSPDGRRLAIKADPREIRVWDVPSHSVMATLPTQSSEALDLSNDGEWVAADQPDKSIVVRRLNTGEEVKLPFSGANPNWLKFAPDAQRLAVSSMRPPLVQIWDLATRTFTNFVHPGGVLQMAWRPDSRSLAAACEDGNIYIWDVQSARADVVLRGHESVVHYVDFHPSGRWLVSWSWDGSSRLWDTFGGTELLVLPGAVALRFSADGRRLSFASGLQLGIWELGLGDESARLKSVIPEGHRPFAFTAAFSPDGRLLAVACVGGLQLRHGTTAELLAVLPSKRCMSVVFHPRDQALLMGDDQGLWRWPMHFSTAETKETEFILGPPQRMRSVGRRPVSQVLLSTDGATLVTHEQHASEALVLEYPGGTIRGRLRKSCLRYLSLSPDGSWVAGGNWHCNGVRVWDLRTASPVKDLPASGTATTQFSPDGRWLLVGTTEAYQLWEVGSWKLGRILPRTDSGDLGAPAAFSRTGAFWAVALNDRLVQLVDAQNGHELATLDPSAYENPQPIMLSPDGSRLAISCEYLGLRIWNLSRLQRHVADFGLDWPGGDAPPALSPSALRPVRVRVLTDSESTTVEGDP